MFSDNLFFVVADDEAQHEIADPVPQDDDGFESLNGNDASSDDRENVVVESKAEQTKSDSVPSTSKVNNFCEEVRYENLACVLFCKWLLLK